MIRTYDMFSGLGGGSRFAAGGQRHRLETWCCTLAEQLGVAYLRDEDDLPNELTVFRS